MKKIILLSATVLSTFGFMSCERCATCTTFEDDPNAIQDERTTEICGRGRQYTDQVTIYERTNWECAEN